MKRMLFVLILGMPGVAWAGLSVQQDAPVPRTAQNHHPQLFEVKFVLRPAPKQDGGLPQVQLDRQAAAIVPVHWGQQTHRRLGLPGPGPNVEICQGWGCEGFGQR
ncbi:MAG TPA: hypothetical protein VJR95_02340 [Rhodanobacter sp.]|nr:hypothetical protein [Rhodanobacter sp.]